MSVINVYSDFDRYNACGIPSVDFSGDIEDRAKVYDMALRILAAYHIIEWVRMTVFLVTLLLGQNFLPIWYATALNTLFGIAAYIYAHVIRYSGNGKECAEEQPYRASMLTAEVIVFWVTFFIMSAPQLFLVCMSQESKEAALVEGEDEEGEEE